ncbi:hypothetical protein HYV84_00415 [Candidatus Woesearchaeota archaeon]|nr:hypothetical protein [Candidatus Woesearchaeota archaeon]
MKRTIRTNLISAAVVTALVGLAGLTYFANKISYNWKQFKKSKTATVHVFEQTFDDGPGFWHIQDHDHTFSDRPDNIDKKTATHLIASFNGEDTEKYRPRESKFWSYSSERMPFTNFIFQDLDVNRDGVVHVPSVSFLRPQELVIYRTDNGLWVFTDGLSEKLLPCLEGIGWPDYPASRSSFTDAGILAGRDSKSLFQIANQASHKRVFVDPDSIDKKFPGMPGLSRNSCIIEETNSGYIIRTPETKDLFYCRKAGMLDLNSMERRGIEPILLGGKPQGIAYDVYTAIHEQAKDGLSALEKILGNPRIRVAVFGEMHEDESPGGETHAKFLSETIPLLVRYGYAIGIEVDRDILQSGFGRADKLFELYNQGVNQVEGHSVEDGVHQFLSTWLGKHTIGFVEKCHRNGIPIIPLDNRRKVREAYFEAWRAYRENGGNLDEFEEKLPGFSLTRDHVMCSNVVEYITADPKNRLATVIGRNHASGSPQSIRVIGDISVSRGSLLFGGGGPKIIFGYNEAKPLGFRLEEALGDEQVVLIGIYDNWYIPQRMLAAGIREDNSPKCVDFRAEVDCLEMHCLFTEKKALIYDPRQFSFFDSSLEHSLVVLPK